MCVCVCVCKLVYDYEYVLLSLMFNRMCVKCKVTSYNVLQTNCAFNVGMSVADTSCHYSHCRDSMLRCDPTAMRKMCIMFKV